MNSYTVHHFNFDRVTGGFRSLEQAMNYAISVCFEAVIYANGERVATFSPISGLRKVS